MEIKYILLKNSCFLFPALFLLFSCNETEPVIAEISPVYERPNCDSLYQRDDGETTFYETNPTYFDTYDDSWFWQISTPHEENLDTALLSSGIASLEKSSSIFSLIIIRKNKIVVEKYFNDSGPQQSNNVHSASKSMLSALFGIAIREGFIENLDVKVSHILPEYFNAEDDSRKLDITLKHLLTMSAGLFWIEDDTEYLIENCENWVRAILEQQLVSLPGENFNYSTGLSHTLAAVLTKATGLNLCEFAHEYLFNHLYITTEHWGRDPQKISSGGYNFYITPRELARFGQLYLNGGELNGTKVIPLDWVSSSLKKQIRVDDIYSYGYYWWLREINGYEIKMAWGYGGQFIILIPKMDIVLVVTSDTKNNYDEPDIEKFIADYLIPIKQ
ncbi:MAG: beta-lactamase family protein [Melioribacteraceae bacterium]|nr:beta-lactamase family protein [Melioribacteraceae bacterium]